ncbi:MAG: SDR family NAD(P)-dependent oxidoreductase, partial [Gemmataceae bacterium]|nr:SDR family NAD(P)-dependent oxidoreductase [Gemmataceae bacterium]
GRQPANVEALRKELGEGHSASVVDVADDAAVQAWAKRVLKEHGPPDLVLSNAAIINETRPLWEIGAEEFGRLIDVNVKGVASVARAFLPAMIARGAGVLVNFSSGWGRGTSPEVAPYCASKYAVEGMTLALAKELPRGLAAVPFNPGIIDTDMLRSAWGDSAGSYPSPEKWAAKVVPFLLGLGPMHNGKQVTAPG